LGATVDLTTLDPSRRGVVTGTLSKLHEQGDEDVNKPLRNLSGIALLLAMGTVCCQQALAAAPKPALTIAVASYDKIIGDIKALDELSGHTKLAAKAEALIELQTNGKGLAGLDKSRPWSVMVSLGEGDKPIVQGYLPVKDLKQLLSSLPLPGGAPAANAKGVYEISAGDKTLYVKQHDKWAVFSDDEEALESAAADPTATIADLTKKYLISVRGSVQNIPEATRENAIKSMRGLAELSLMAMQQQGTEEQKALVENNVKQIFETLETLSKELNDLVIGIGMDSSTKALFLDFEARGVDGSDLAKKFAAMKGAKTDFAGFALPGAALTILSSGVCGDEDVAAQKAQIATLKKTVDKMLDSNDQLGDKRELAKSLVADLFDVAIKTIELKKNDGGMSVVLNDGPGLIGGTRIGGGEKLEKTVKKLVKAIAEDEPKVNDMVKLDAETYEGVKFHVATLPIPDAKAAAVFGETVQIVLGTSESALYFGAGKNPVEAIKKAIDASKSDAGKAINPMEMVISGAPIAKFFAKAIPKEEDPQAKKNFGKAAAALAKSGGKDHITMTVKVIPNGSSMRLNVESGVTKAILDQLPGSSSDSEGSDDN
jgi:hypothetical protein